MSFRADGGPSPAAYLDSSYASSLVEFGQPLELPRSEGWYLRRRIPGSDHVDGMGCYPLLACRHWRALPADLDELAGGLVSFCGVADPFGAYEVADLERAFPDRLIRFKDHFVADLSRPIGEIVSTGHRKLAEKALSRVEVAFYERPIELLDEWVTFFAQTIERFGIRGISAYSPAAFARQFQMPGVFMSVARHEGEMVAAHIQITGDHVAYAHLAAGSPMGRELGADYALYLSEIGFYSDKVNWLDWGGVAGARAGDDRGLERFKRGWSTDTRPVYFGGRILDPVRYDQLSANAAADAQRYFPSYRAGEFG